MTVIDLLHNLTYIKNYKNMCYLTEFEHFFELFEKSNGGILQLLEKILRVSVF